MTIRAEASLAQYSGACVVCERESLKLTSGNAGNCIVAREPVIYKGVVRCPQVERVMIIMDLAFEEKPRFAPESLLPFLSGPHLLF
jgi:hypothetical protein